MEDDNLEENKNGVDSISGVNEGYMYLDIYRAIEPLITPGGILIDMGHGKNLQFPVRLTQTIAKYFPNKEMVYYDTSDPEIVRGWFNSLKSQIKRNSKKKIAQLAIKAKQIVGEIPDSIKWIDSPKEYLGKASEVCFFFTKHHFEDPRSALKTAYDLLKQEEDGEIYTPGGLLL